MKTYVMPDPVRTAEMNTAQLRAGFLVDDIFAQGEIRLVYADVDRTVLGGIVPLASPLTLGTDEALRSEYFTERRELGILNVGKRGWVKVEGKTFELENLDCLYVGKGNREISFGSADAQTPAEFYLLSYPAHMNYPTTLAKRSAVEGLHLGTQATCNKRILYKYIHPAGIKSCQLVMGFTQMEPGSAWNTMPPHTHMRRSEVYLYFDVAPEARVFHLMGEPTQTRHLVVANKQAVISPSWSIHSGVGTMSYTFCWGMGGENQAFDDMGRADNCIAEINQRNKLSENLFNLDGKTALVTGSKRGIGKSMAIALARAGADIIGVSNSMESTGSDVEKEILALGKKFRAYACDFSKRKALYSFIEQVQKDNPRIDILVNNAGTILRKPAAEHSDDYWDQVMEVNLNSQFILSREIGKKMLAQGEGKIVFTASLLTFQGGITVPGYAASKGGIGQLTKALANEWAGKGVNVNAIAPGYISTDNTTALRADEERNKSILGRIPAGRWGEPSDLDGAIVFLCSKASAYIHGTILPVDGGWLGR